LNKLLSHNAPICITKLFGFIEAAPSRAQNLIVVLALYLASSFSYALDVGGKLTDESGGGVPGAMVTLAGENINATTISVFTDSSGDYRFNRVPVATLDGVKFKVKVIGYEQVGEPVLGPHSGDVVEANISMQAIDNVAHQVPPSAWMAQFPDQRATHAVMLNCAQCHQFPHSKVRDYASKLVDLDANAREQVWRQIFLYMRVKAIGIMPEGLDIDLATVPLEVFKDDANNGFSHGDQITMAPALASYMKDDFSSYSLEDYNKLRAPLGNMGTQIREFQLPPPATSMFHDTNIVRGPDGRLTTWSVDWINRRMARIYVDTGELKMFDMPKGTIGAHTIIPDNNGKLWTTFQVSGHIGRFDPVTESWQLWKTGGRGWTQGGAGLVHSFANTANFRIGFDGKNRVWASLGGVNKLVGLNPSTGSVETFAAPPTEGDSAFSSGLYGGVMSSDGKHVWFTQLQGHLFSFNTETERVETVIPFPRGSGPRRLAIDKNDVIYLPLFGAGELYVYDARAKKEIGRYPLPDRAAAPYTVTWDPARNAVWFGSGNSNLIYRFDIDTKKFVEYPLPSGEGTLVRAIAVDELTGNIYFSYSPVAQLKKPHMVVEIKPGEPEPVEQTAALQ
jgi:streptogramin lyase